MEIDDQTTSPPTSTSSLPTSNPRNPLTNVEVYFQKFFEKIETNEKSIENDITSNLRSISDADSKINSFREQIKILVKQKKFLQQKNKFLKLSLNGCRSQNRVGEIQGKKYNFLLKRERSEEIHEEFNNVLNYEQCDSIIGQNRCWRESEIQTNTGSFCRQCYSKRLK